MKQALWLAGAAIPAWMRRNTTEAIALGDANAWLMRCLMAPPASSPEAGQNADAVLILAATALIPAIRPDHFGK